MRISFPFSCFLALLAEVHLNLGLLADAEGLQLGELFDFLVKLGHVLAGRFLVLAEGLLFCAMGLFELTHRRRQTLQLLTDALHFL